MDRFAHGGDVTGLPGVLDFSASLSPLGIPEPALEVLRSNVEAFAAYPDPACRGLTAAIAAFEGVDERLVLPCAGATDALTRLCQALRPSHVLVCAPCYSGYEQAAEQVGATVVRHLLRDGDDFVVGLDLVDAITAEVGVVFLANPNNPTGRLLSREVLLACLERAARVGAVVALDECFVDLAGGGGSNDLLAGHPNLVIVKALTKTFALAGLRVGYALCADERLLGRLREAGQPWAVSVPAQLAGVTCLGDRGYLARACQVVSSERERLRAALAAWGFRVVPSEANYLLFEADETLGARLLGEGVMVRSCENFVGLGARWYRVAVRAPHENALLVEALGKVMR